jgi:hypothetical protein
MHPHARLSPVSGDLRILGQQPPPHVQGPSITCLTAIPGDELDLCGPHSGQQGGEILKTQLWT